MEEKGIPIQNKKVVFIGKLIGGIRTNNRNNDNVINLNSKSRKSPIYNLKIRTMKKSRLNMKENKKTSRINVVVKIGIFPRE